MVSSYYSFCRRLEPNSLELAAAATSKRVAIPAQSKLYLEQIKDKKVENSLLPGPGLSIFCGNAVPQIEYLIKDVARENQEEAKETYFFCFWGCLNNYLADVVSMAAITPGRRARHHQWGQQSALGLLWGDNTPAPNSVKQPSGFLSNGKDSQIKSSTFCKFVIASHAGESGRLSKANNGADRVVYSVLYFVWWLHAFWLKHHPSCVKMNCWFWPLLFRSCDENILNIQRVLSIPLRSLRQLVNKLTATVFVGV